MRTRESREGIALVEFAMVMALLLVPLIAGVLDVSKFIDINQILTRSAREGVVAASRGIDPTLQVRQSVEAAGLESDVLLVSVVHGPELEGLGQEVRVELSYNFSGMTIFPWEGLLPQGITADASAKME